MDMAGSNEMSPLTSQITQELEDSNPQGHCESQMSQAVVCTVASHIK